MFREFFFASTIEIKDTYSEDEIKDLELSRSPSGPASETVSGKINTSRKNFAKSKLVSPRQMEGKTTIVGKFEGKSLSLSAEGGKYDGVSMNSDDARRLFTILEPLIQLRNLRIKEEKDNTEKAVPAVLSDEMRAKGLPKATAISRKKTK